MSLFLKIEIKKKNVVKNILFNRFHLRIYNRKIKKKNSKFKKNFRAFIDKIL